MVAEHGSPCSSASVTTCCCKVRRWTSRRLQGTNRILQEAPRAADDFHTDLRTDIRTDFRPTSDIDDKDDTDDEFEIIPKVVSRLSWIQQNTMTGIYIASMILTSVM